MCFARTFMTFRVLEHTLKQAIPFAIYQRGCKTIAHAAATVLQDLGLGATVEVVAMFKRLTGVWIPHYVVVCDGQILDFKRRVFGEQPNGLLREVDPQLGRGHSVYGGSVHNDGWYPEERRFILRPTTKTFAMKDDRRKFAQFVLHKDTVTDTCQDDQRAFRNSVKICRELFGV